MKKLQITALIFALMGGISAVQAQSKITPAEDEKATIEADIVKDRPKPNHQHVFSSDEGEASKVQLQLFPNPNQGHFTVKLDKDIKNNEISIINILGQKVYSYRPGFNETSFEVDMKNNPRGIYILTYGKAAVKFKVL